METLKSGLFSLNGSRWYSSMGFQFALPFVKIIGLVCGLCGYKKLIKVQKALRFARFGVMWHVGLLGSAFRLTSKTVDLLDSHKALFILNLDKVDSYDNHASMNSSILLVARLVLI